MKEHTKKKVNVLDIDVSVMRPDKAVNITMNYINRKERSTIFFHTAASSLFCQSNVWAAEWMQQSCNLVFAGDRYMTNVIENTSSETEFSQGNSLFADTYLKRLLHRLNREGHEIFAVMSKQEYLDSLKEYISFTYPDIIMKGEVLDPEASLDPERIVNEINGTIPDIVFMCLPADIQVSMTKEYESMMNTHLVICIDSLQPMAVTETESIPGWIESLHLTKLYHWFRKEGKLHDRIVGSIFRRTVDEQNNEFQSDLESTEESAGTDDSVFSDHNEI